MPRARKSALGKWDTVCVDRLVGACAESLYTTVTAEEWEKLKTCTDDDTLVRDLCARCGVCLSVAERAVEELRDVATLGWPAYVDGREARALSSRGSPLRQLVIWLCVSVFGVLAVFLSTI